MITNYDVIVIGGGASGMMSAIFASNNKFSTLIIDHNEKLGKKLYITGKGKCNLTNNSSIENHMANIVTNPKFMYSALNNFSPQDTMQFFEDNGLKLRTERGNRIFPNSDKSSDVIKTLEKILHKNGVKITLNTEIKKVYKQDNVFYILCNNDIMYTCNSLIIATGGLSYSGTGATAFGMEIAKQFGHNIIDCKSALCPIVVKENVSDLNGLKLTNVKLFTDIEGKHFEEQGEMLFTYTSLTGPIALTMSSKINKLNLKNKKIFIDFKPALSKQKLEEKFKREFIEYAKKDLKNYLFTLLPNSFVEFFMKHYKLVNKKIADMSKNDREILINGLKEFDFSIKSLDNINVSIVTSGGVDVKQINSKTCESKLVENLYFVGEVLDIDALTGGFNLQIAWSTGYLAGNNIKG